MARLAGLLAATLFFFSATAATASVRPLPLDAPLAQLGPRSDEAEDAEQLMSQGDFEEAVKVLQRGLSQPDVSDDVLVELYRLMGLAQLYLGNEDKARDAYEKLLQARPDYDLPKSAPPKIRELYTRIKEDVRKRRVRPVTITAETIESHPGGEPLEVQAHVEDLALGARPKFYYRRAGAQSYSSVDLVREKGSREEFHATVPAYEIPAEPRPWDVEYYFEVSDAAQRRLAGRGDPFNPLHFTVEPAGGVAAEESKAWYQNPWVYVVGGALVAGTATAAVLVATSQPTGNLPVQIRVNP